MRKKVQDKTSTPPHFDPFAERKNFVISPIGEDTGERFFAEYVELQEKPALGQQKASDGPVVGQPWANEKPSGLQQKASTKNAIEHARKHLPQKKHLLDEVSEKWFIIEALQKQVDFKSFIQQFSQNKTRYCPRPIFRELEQQVQPNVSRSTVTRTLHLYIEYTELYKETASWSLFFNGLNRFDAFLNRMLNF